MDEGSQKASLGDTAWFASLAYIAVLLPWTIFIAHDFISDRWDTIRNSKKSGRLHLLAFILAPVLVSYIVWQPMSNEPDFKEMFTAITALLFGVYHFLRSLIGINQLHWFQTWATTVATLMDRGGYWQEPQQENQGQTRKQKKQCGVKERIITILFSRYQNSRLNSKNLETMKVNNSIVDNELADSQCPDVAYVLEQKIVHYFILGLWTRISRIFAGKRKDLGHAKLTTFVRWAVAFLSQYGNNWLMDVADTALIRSQLRRTNKRHEFAVKVLAAATLRLGEIESPLKEFYMPGLGLNLVAEKSYLPLGAWYRITKQMDDIVFSKEVFARASLSTSFHMPGYVPVIEWDGNGEDHDKTKTQHYRHLFDPLIAEARSALHPIDREYLQRHGTFSSQQLEWFAAFLCTQCVFDNDQRNADNFAVRKQPQQVFSAKKGSSIRQRRGREDENDTSVGLLRRQLGLADHVASRTFFYPFLKCAYNRHFWGNRAILEVSARVDNWTAISSGRHVSFLSREQIFWGTQKFSKAHGTGTLGGFPRVSCANEWSESLEPNSCFHESDETQTEDEEFSLKIFKYHQELETEALKYQLIDEQTTHWHLEHGLSFLGCVVESVRSALAEETFLSGSSLQGWCPKLPNEKVKFFASLELWNCINGAEDFDTAVQERLLWECQQSVYSSLRRKIAEQDRKRARGFAIQKEVETMLLFLMGFPSIQITQNSRDIPAFTIRPVLAPQPLKVHVLMHKSKYHPLLGTITPTAVLCIDARTEKGCAPTNRFCWRDWRDAFEGRLQGRFDWQQNHFLPGADLMSGKKRRETLAKPTVQIRAYAKGENPPLVWHGWAPFRPGMAIFELKHVLSSKEGEPSSKDFFKRHKSVTDNYHDTDKSSPALLRAAMLRLNALLGHGEGLNKLKEDLKPTRRLNEGLNKKDSSPVSKIRQYIREILPFLRGSNEKNDANTEDSQASNEVGGGQADKDVNEAHALLDKLLNESIEFEAKAMYNLACCLDGSDSCTPEVVLNLMQGALHIDRTESIAKSVIDKLLTGSSRLSTRKRQEAIEKAKYAVDLLWLDVEARHKKEWKATHARQMDGEILIRWKQLKDKERLTRVIQLHKRVLMEHETEIMMNELAEQITRYGTLKTHENFAIELYESAAIAYADPLPILKLATIYASRTFGSEKNDRTYAWNLLKKGLHIAKTGPHDDILDGHAVRLQSKIDVIVELYELAKSRDRGARWLFEKYHDLLSNSKDEDERKLYKELSSFLQSDDDEYGKRFVAKTNNKSDSVVLDMDP